MYKEVNSIMLKFLVVVLVSILKELLANGEYIIIQRNSGSNNGASTVQPDRFIIPSSLCLGSQQCIAMDGSGFINCTCDCNARSTDGDFNSATFGLYGGWWKCLQNYEVHEVQRGGCSIILNNWRNDSALVTIPKDGAASYEIPNKFINFHIYAPTTKYQQCDGSWTYFDNDQIIAERFFKHDEGGKQYLKFNYSGDSLPSLTGRIIKIGIAYYNKSNSILISCVLLKMEGRMQCPFSLPTTVKTSTAEPSISSSNTVEASSMTVPKIVTKLNRYTSSTKRSGTHTVTKTPSTRVPTTVKTSTAEPSNSSSNTVEASSKKIATKVNRYTSSTKRSGTRAVTKTPSTRVTSIPFFKNRGKNSADHSDTASLIAGPVAGAIALIAFIIIIILVRRRNKRVRNVASTTSAVAENLAYEKSQDNFLRFTDRVHRSAVPDQEEEYSYAYTNGINRRDMDRHPRKQDSQTNVTNVTYGTIPGYSPNQEAPIYNTLDDPEFTKPKINKPETSSDIPIYDTLEDPEYTNPNKAKKQHNEPLYNVLERPYPEGGAIEGINKEEPPCYHVLEGPYSDSARVYDVLEEPESNMARPPNKSTPTKIPRENREYNDTVYDSVGGVIPDTGDIYQQLNQNGQRETDVYQALKLPNMNLMPLVTKLNESCQSDA